MAKVAPRRIVTKPQVVLPETRHALSAEEVIADYRLAYRSRVASVIGRREVLTGKAGFGIFGDGKEVPQLAMAKAFRDGDWRSGYYRDQTFMLATGMVTLEQWFAGLYADPDVEHEPHSGGRQMNSHFASRSLDAEGRWRPLARMKNSSADLASVSGQMPRLLGLAYASKLLRADPLLREAMSDLGTGDEVAFGTIGDAGTSEGLFWEALNAAAVLQVPLAVSVWDDGYGISVPIDYQTAKGSISEAVAGMRREGDRGIDLYAVKAHDYVGLCDTYLAAIDRVRREHIPALIHVKECTQPQGHSTSGSHERYKSKERLAWESEVDCIRRMRAWVLAEALATAEQLDGLEAEERKHVEEVRRSAYESALDPIRRDRDEAVQHIERAAGEAPARADLEKIVTELRGVAEPSRLAVQVALARAATALRGEETPAKADLLALRTRHREENRRRYTSFLHSESAESPLRVPEVKPSYPRNAEVVDGRVMLRRNFDANLARDPRIFAIGEDVGRLGDVNLAMEGLQAKHGEHRVTDTGIREATIVGQGIGAALRGLRPIVEIQYVDYLPFAIEPLTDDLATTHWRTSGGQKAPVIVRTRGHRLQGIWHTGSPMSMILGACRGVYLCVPRDMTRAAGMYNTLLRGDNPAIVVEVLNGYRVKERMPSNIGDFTVPLGIPEVLREGTDVSVVTYGALVRIALEAANALALLGVETEVIDVQTLDPFDRERRVVRSLEKTSAVLFLDEDVPGGASAYMFQQVLEAEEGWRHLDAAPRTLSSTPSRTPYSNDGDYFTKPNREDIVEAVYALARERDPRRFPPLAE